MSRLALYFVSGESLYLGATLLLVAVIAPAFLKRVWMLRARNALAWAACALIVMACPPFSLLVLLIFVAVFVVWFITSNQSSASPTTIRWQTGSRVVLAAMVLILPAIEFTHRKMPTIKANSSDHLVVIGDSISSGIDPHIDAWPLVFQKICGVEVKNLARPGAQVAEALLIAGDLKDADHLVLIEIGGNDLLMGVSAEEYDRTLDTLLSKVAAPNRTVVMFELPLFPNRIAFGRIQRRLSAKYHVALIPKRYFAQVLGDANATTDGLHLSVFGTRRMVELVAEILSPPLKPCEKQPKVVAD